MTEERQETADRKWETWDRRLEIGEGGIIYILYIKVMMNALKKINGSIN